MIIILHESRERDSGIYDSGRPEHQEAPGRGQPDAGRYVRNCRLQIFPTDRVRAEEHHPEDRFQNLQEAEHPAEGFVQF